MSYSAEVSRKSSGMNIVYPTMGEVLERISAYDKDFPGEILDVKISRIPSVSESRDQSAKDKQDAHQALAARAIDLMDQGYSESAIAKDMGVSRSTVRILTRTPVNSEEWTKHDNTKA